MPSVVADIGDRIETVAQRLHASAESVVPIVERGRLTGVASAADIAVAVATGKGQQRIAEISTSVVETLPPDATLEQAAALLAEQETPLVPVIGRDGELLGVITRRDVLNVYRSSIDLVTNAATRPRTTQ
jgi:CBS domain-containing protein